jgi:hypothetical protein
MSLRVRAVIVCDQCGVMLESKHVTVIASCGRNLIQEAKLAGWVRVRKPDRARSYGWIHLCPDCSQPIGSAVVRGDGEGI